MIADYVISRIDNGYILSSCDEERYFARLHDMLMHIKEKEADRGLPPVKFIDADGTCHGE